MKVEKFKPENVSKVSSFLEERFLDFDEDMQFSQSDKEEIFNHCKESYILKQNERENSLILTIEEGGEIVGMVVGEYSNSSPSVMIYSKRKKEVIEAFEEWCKEKDFESIYLIDYSREPFVELEYEEEKVVDDGYGNEEIVMKKVNSCIFFGFQDIRPHSSS